MTTFPTPQPDQGATSPPDLDPSATASGNDGSGELRAEAGDFADDATLVALAAVIDPDAMAISGNLPIAEAMGWMARQDRALLDAHAVHEAGYRLVSEDDATVAGMVHEFHVAFNLPINDTTRTHNKLRADLIREEAGEAGEALESGDLEHIAKELADLVIVAHGAALTLGINLDRAVALVHESNMSKLVDGRPDMRDDGKVLKGPNYRPPDMSAAVRALREANSQPTPNSSQAGSSRHHDCCPHCTARTGSCVRCGVRDAADGEQLCGQCDTEVEAEATGRALREAGQ